MSAIFAASQRQKGNFKQFSDGAVNVFRHRVRIFKLYFSVVILRSYCLVFNVVEVGGEEVTGGKPINKKILSQNSQQDWVWL
jgi:hypothetical protein